MNATDIAHLEATGEAGVLLEIARGDHGAKDSPIRSQVEAWLRSKRVVAEAEASAKRSAREEETLSVAREALSVANLQAASAASQAASAAKAAVTSLEQARWAKMAAIIATTAALVASKDEIIALVTSWLR